MKNIYEFTGNYDDDYFINENNMSGMHWELLTGCYHQGECDDDTKAASPSFDIKDYEAAMAHLIEWGIEEERFIDSDGGRDESAILEYYLWVIAGDISERENESEGE